MEKIRNAAEPFACIAVWMVAAATMFSLLAVPSRAEAAAHAQTTATTAQARTSPLADAPRATMRAPRVDIIVPR